MEAANLLGYTEVPVRFQGAPVWAPDPTLVGKDWLVEMLGLPDNLLRDERGATIEMTERRPVPWVQILASLSHAFPSEFVPTSRVESQITNLTRGATRASEISDEDAGAPYVPPKPAVPMLEVLEPEPDSELEAMLGDMTVSADVSTVDAVDVDIRQRSLMTSSCGCSPDQKMAGLTGRKPSTS